MRMLWLMAAVLIALGAAWVVLKVMPEDEETNEVRVVEVQKVVEKEVPTSEVLVAKTYIPIGASIELKRHIEYQPWPSHLILPGFIVAPEEGGVDLTIQSQVARSPFQAGEPIIRSKLANPEDPSFIPSSLGKGMRAVTIPVGPITGVAGFVFPGDRVDILITHNVKFESKEKKGRKPVRSQAVEIQQISEVLLSDVKVLAIDQRATSEGQQGPMIPSSVTLEVTKEDAQRLKLAERNGQLSLSLRSLEDRMDPSVARPVAKADLTRTQPPSYWPKLYKTSSNYTTEVVDAFEDVDLEGLSASERDAIAAERMGFSDDGELVSSGKGGVVVVIRGMQREEVGVNRP